jgi:hypothetical protein
MQQLFIKMKVKAVEGDGNFSIVLKTLQMDLHGFNHVNGTGPNGIFFLLYEVIDLSEYVQFAPGIFHLFDMPFIRQGEIKLQELHWANITALFGLPYHVLRFSGFVGQKIFQFLYPPELRREVPGNTARSLVPILRGNRDTGSNQDPASGRMTILQKNEAGSVLANFAFADD